MRKFFKILSAVFATIVGVTVIAFAVIFNLDFNDYREDIAAQVSKSIGRPFKINGSLDVDISVTPKVQVEGITLGNADWSANPEMLVVDKLLVEVDLLSLLFGPLDVHKVVLSGAEVLLETAPSGIENYDFSQINPAQDNQPGEEGQIVQSSTKIQSEGIELPILRQIELNNINVTFFDGVTSDTRSLEIKEISLIGEQPTEPMQLAVQAEGSQGITATLNGVLGSLDSLLDSDNPWDVNIFGDIAGVAVDVSGAIDDPSTGAGLNLKLAADGQELSKVAKLLLLDMPEIGKFKLDANLTGSVGQDMRIADLKMEIGSQQTILINAKGGIEDLNKMNGIDLDVKLASSELGNLSPFTEKFANQILPNMGALDMSAKLSGGLNDGIKLDTIDLDIGTPDYLKVMLNGSMSDLATLRGMSLNVVLKSNDVSKLSPLAEKYAGQKIPPLGVLDVKSRLSGSLSNAISLDALDLSLGDVNLIKLMANGSVGNLLNQTGINLIVSSEAVDIGRVNKITKEYDLPEVPDIGPLSFTGAVTGDLQNNMSMRDINLRAGDGKRFKLYASGAVADLLTPKGVSLDIDVKMQNLANMSELAGQVLPAIGPIDLQATIAGDQATKLTVSNLEALLGASDIKGNLTYDAMANKPVITGQFSSKLVRKSDFSGNRKVAANDNSESWNSPANTNTSSNTTKQSSGKYVISEEPFDLSALTFADAKLSAKIATLDVDGAQFKNVSLPINLTNGKLVVPSLSFVDRNGNPADVGLSVDASKKNPKFGLQVTASNFEVAELIQLANMPPIMSGPMQINVDLKSAGSSPHEIASKLNGAASLLLENGLIDGQQIREHYVGDSQILTNLLLGQADEGKQPIYCIAYDYTVKNGLIVTNTSVFDAKSSTVSSTGDVNLATEQLGLTVTPHRTVVGLPTTVPILIGGTFKNPRYAANPVGTVLNLTQSLLGGAVNVVTLGEMGDGLFSESSPCVNLRPSMQKQHQTEQQQLQKELIEKPEKVIKNLLQGIFQN